MKTPELLYGHDEDVARWVGQKIDVPDFGPLAAIGVISPDAAKVLAGVVFHSYRKEYSTIQISMASVSKLWAHRMVIAKLLAYPFRQLKVHMVYTGTPQWNRRALRFNEHVGFGSPIVLEHWFGPNKAGVHRHMTCLHFEKHYGGLLDG